MKKMRILAALLCVVMIVTVAAGCGGNDDSQKDTASSGSKTEDKGGTQKDESKVSGTENKLTGKFKVLVVAEQAKDTIDPVTGANISGWDSLVKPYEEQYEGLDIEFVEVPWTDIVQKWETSAQSGTVDVMHLAAGQSNNMGAKGLVVPLDEFIQKDGSFDPEMLYGKNFWNDSAMIQLNGVHYGIPKLAYTFTTIINTKIFDDWGVDYITHDSTYEEILEAASKMTGTNPVTGKKNYGMYTRKGSELLRSLNTYYSKTPAYRTFWDPEDPYSADISEIKFAYTTNDAFIKAYDWMKEAAKYMPPGWTVGEGEENFYTEEGDIAINLMTDSGGKFRNLYIAGEKDLLSRFKCIKLPAFKDADGNTLRGTAPVHTWAVPVSAKDKEGSYEICKILGSKEISEVAYEEKWLSPVFAEGVEWADPEDPYTVVCIEQINESHGYPDLIATSAYGQCYNQELDLLHAYCKGEVTDLKEGLAKIQGAMETWRDDAVKNGTR